MIDLRNVDCLDYMKTCADDEFDLAIVDPPYGINAGRGTSVFMAYNPKWKGAQDKRQIHTGDWDQARPGPCYFSELFRVTKNQIIWGGNYFIDYLQPSPAIVVWDKQNGNSFFADGEMAWTSFPTKLRIFRHRSIGFCKPAGLPHSERIHPTQKPIQLYEFLLRTYANPGDRILDTHMGSGSVAIACSYLGFDLVACEIDPVYYNKALERIKKETRQQRLPI